MGRHSHRRPYLIDTWWTADPNVKPRKGTRVGNATARPIIGETYGVIGYEASDMDDVWLAFFSDFEAGYYAGMWVKSTRLSFGEAEYFLEVSVETQCLPLQAFYDRWLTDDWSTE